MLTGELLHPGILQALAAAGHGSTILIADGNFPVSTVPAAAVPSVFLGLAPDRLSVTDVLPVIVRAIPAERVAVMAPDGQPSPAIHTAIREIVGAEIAFDEHRREPFYALVRGPDLALVIATADTRPFANVLLTIGVRVERS